MPRTSRTAHDGATWYWLREEDDGRVEVRKYLKHENGEIELETTYEITERTFCNCPQARHRGDRCKHLNLLDGRVETKPVSMTQAKELTKQVLADFASFAEQLVLPDDWATKLPDGTVSRVKIRVFKPKSEILQGRLISPMKDGPVFEFAEQIEDWGPSGPVGKGPNDPF